MAIANIASGINDSLDELVKRRLFEQMQAAQIQHLQQQDAAEYARVGLEGRRVGQGDRSLDQNASQFDARLGLDKDEFGFKKQTYADAAPKRAESLRHTTAETDELLRRPAAEEIARNFTLGRDKTQHGFRLGEIGAQGKNALDVANVRGENGPVIKIQTTDADGKPVTRVLPRGQAAGQDFAAAPTTEQRNRTASAGRANPVVQAISELSEKINTGNGALATVQGTVAKAQAKANLDDDVSEYQAVVSGFTPLLARAMGHTGVLTEQDVQSVRSMLPQPTDSKSVRDRKVNRIESLLGNMGGASPASGGADLVWDGTKFTKPGGKP